VRILLDELLGGAKADGIEQRQYLLALILAVAHMSV